MNSYIQRVLNKQSEHIVLNSLRPYLHSEIIQNSTVTYEVIRGEYCYILNTKINSAMSIRLVFCSDLIILYFEEKDLAPAFDDDDISSACKMIEELYMQNN